MQCLFGQKVERLHTVSEGHRERETEYYLVSEQQELII